jgi:hypothetical protein
MGLGFGACMRRVFTVIKLEVKFFIAAVLIVVYSCLVVFPSLVYRPLWKSQNRLVDKLDKWAFEPMYQHRRRNA